MRTTRTVCRNSHSKPLRVAIIELRTAEQLKDDLQFSARKMLGDRSDIVALHPKFDDIDPATQCHS